VARAYKAAARLAASDNAPAEKVARCRHFFLEDHARQPAAQRMMTKGEMPRSLKRDGHPGGV
jgi:hypothetical protein